MLEVELVQEWVLGRAQHMMTAQCVKQSNEQQGEDRQR